MIDYLWIFMIDIIIQTHNTSKIIEQTLFSISYQTISDKINVYIVNNDSDINYSKDINFFKKFINIKELRCKKNMETWYVRQYGLNNSNANTIYFLYHFYW